MCAVVQVYYICIFICIYYMYMSVSDKTYINWKTRPQNFYSISGDSTPMCELSPSLLCSLHRSVLYFSLGLNALWYIMERTSNYRLQTRVWTFKASRLNHPWLKVSICCSSRLSLCGLCNYVKGWEAVGAWRIPLWNRQDAVLTPPLFSQ